MKLKAAVTGGAGFIGSHLVDALCERGFDVLVIDDFSTGSEKNLAAACGTGCLQELVHADLCSAEASAAILQFKPRLVFHFAAQINVRTSVEDPAFDADKNVCGTVRMLEACRQAGTKQFVFSSTGGAIYGEQDIFPAPETHPIRPESPYGVGKRAAELYLEYYGRCFGMSTTALRFANVYGPRQNPKGEAGVVAIFCERLMASEEFVVFGDGTQTRDYVYVSDIVNANMLVAENVVDPGYSVFNVGTGEETSVLQIVDGFRTLWRDLRGAGADQEIQVRYAAARPGEQQRSVIDATLLSTAFAWQPEYAFHDGLAATIRWYL